MADRTTSSALEVKPPVVDVYMKGVRDLCAELAARRSIGHNNPGLETEDGRTEFSVIDPFGNRLRFGELQ